MSQYVIPFLPFYSKKKKTKLQSKTTEFTSDTKSCLVTFKNSQLNASRYSTFSISHVTFNYINFNGFFNKSYEASLHQTHNMTEEFIYPPNSRSSQTTRRRSAEELPRERAASRMLTRIASFRGQRVASCYGDLTSSLSTRLKFIQHYDLWNHLKCPG